MVGPPLGADVSGASLSAAMVTLGNCVEANKMVAPAMVVARNFRRLKLPVA